jgi:Glycosyl hydrolases family 2, TIM barrel domain
MKPFKFPKLKPVKKVTVDNNSILINGKPFVPIMFSHDFDISHATAFHEKLTALGDNVHCLYSNSKFGKNTNDEIIEANIQKMKKLLKVCWDSNSYGRVVLSMPIWGFNNKSKKFNLKNIKKVVEALKDHPALFMWTLIDEPEIRKIPVEEVKRAYDLVKSIDPNHPIQTNLCNPDLFNYYSGTSDIASYDRYPYPYINLSEIYNLNKIILESVNNKKPLLCYLQTYNNTGNSLPTPEWLRAEIYLCITQGMNIFSYYSFVERNPLWKSMANSQELQSNIRKYNIELYFLTDMLNAPQVNIPEISALKDNSIHYVYKQVKGEKYFVAVNITDKVKKCEFSLPGSVQKNKIEALFERGKTVKLNNGILKETFLPYEVHIYKY